MEELIGTLKPGLTIIAGIAVAIFANWISNIIWGGRPPLKWAVTLLAGGLAVLVAVAYLPDQSRSKETTDQPTVDVQITQIAIQVRQFELQQKMATGQSEIATAQVRKETGLSATAEIRRLSEAQVTLEAEATTLAVRKMQLEATTATTPQVEQTPELIITSVSSTPTSLPVQTLFPTPVATVTKPLAITATQLITGTKNLSGPPSKTPMRIMPTVTKTRLHTVTPFIPSTTPLPDSTKPDDSTPANIVPSDGPPDILPTDAIVDVTPSP